MDERYEYVCKVRTPEGMRDYVTLLPPEAIFKTGLAPEAIVGVLSPGWEKITPETFARNKVFVEFLHAVIARHGSAQEGLRAEAKRLGDGWVYVIDRRTPTPAGPVSPEDIVGAFQVTAGEVVPGSYRRGLQHRILSANGFFRLDAGLHKCLMEALAALSGG